MNLSLNYFQTLTGLVKLCFDFLRGHSFSNNYKCISIILFTLGLTFGTQSLNNFFQIYTYGHHLFSQSVSVLWCWNCFWALSVSFLSIFLLHLLISLTLPDSHLPMDLHVVQFFQDHFYWFNEIMYIFQDV